MWDFTVGERDWAQLRTPHGQVGIYSHRTEWDQWMENTKEKGAGGGDLGEGVWLNQPNRILAEDRHDQTSPGGW